MLTASAQKNTETGGLGVADFADGGGSDRLAGLDLLALSLSSRALLGLDIRVGGGLLATTAGPAGSLSAFSTGFTRLFRGEFVSLALLVRSATTLAGNLPLPRPVHVGEAAARLAGSASLILLSPVVLLTFIWHATYLLGWNSLIRPTCYAPDKMPARNRTATLCGFFPTQSGNYYFC